MLAAGLLALCPVAGCASEPGQEGAILARQMSVFEPASKISGVARTHYFRSDNRLDDKKDFVGATLGVNLESTLSSEFGTRIEARAANPDAFKGGGTAASLIQAYIAYRTEHVRVRLGKQIVAWGRADGINPTDNLTPRDYVVLLPIEEDQRFGTTALTVDGYLNNEYTLSMFMTPYFAPSRIPLPLEEAVFVDRQPRKRLANSEFGVRLNKAGGRSDWSLSYFHGYNLFPELRPLDFSAGTPILALTYPRIDVLGADFSLNLGRYGLRGELAYFRMPDAGPADSLSRNSYWYYVIGGDRTFEGNLNVNVQLFGRAVQGFHDPQSVPDPGLRSLAVLNALIGGQQDRYSYGVTARIGKTWLNETVRAELLAVVDLTRHDAYLRPVISYDLSDGLRLSAGAAVFHGRDDTFFGRLKKNRGIFAEARYAF